MSGAFAAADARVRAHRGDQEGTRTAITRARDLFEHSRPTTQADDAWAFPYRRLQLYLSGAYTALGDTAQAGQGATPLRRPHRHRPGAAMAGAGDVPGQTAQSEACQLARETYLTVPADHRTQILGARAADIIKITPENVRPRAARELGELLALPSGAT